MADSNIKNSEFAEDQSTSADSERKCNELTKDRTTSAVSRKKRFELTEAAKKPASVSQIQEQEAAN
ncbi:hypothetical protein GCM10008929_01540 [Alkalibacterium psychrotolerans]